MNDREVMKMALEALELEATSPPIAETAAALAALRAALAAPPDAEAERLRAALKQIADETYDPWSNGAKAQRIAQAAFEGER